MSYDGEERRTDSRNHDIMLTRIDANLSNFMKRFEEHTSEDEKSFEKLDARTTRLERFFWIVSGGFAVIEFVVKYLGGK